MRICGSDPLNLVGIIVPGDRIPAIRTREVVYLDGLPIGTGAGAGVGASGSSEESMLEEANASPIAGASAPIAKADDVGEALGAR